MEDEGFHGAVMGGAEDGDGFLYPPPRAQGFDRGNKRRGGRDPPPPDSSSRGLLRKKKGTERVAGIGWVG